MVGLLRENGSDIMEFILKMLSIMFGGDKANPPYKPQTSPQEDTEPLSNQPTEDIKTSPAEAPVEPTKVISKDPTMKTSKRGALEIMSHEAVVLNRYRDTKNIWTIGVGVTSRAFASIDPKVFTGYITVKQAIDLFHEILPKYEKIVDGLLESAGRSVKQHEYDALVSLAYNAGNINKPTTRRYLKEGRPVADAINLWRADKNLWRRRAAEASLASKGIYKSKYISVYTADTEGNVIWRKGKKHPIEDFGSAYHKPKHV